MGSLSNLVISLTTIAAHFCADVDKDLRFMVCIRVHLLSSSSKCLTSTSSDQVPTHLSVILTEITGRVHRCMLRRSWLLSRTSSHVHHGCRCHFGPCPPCHEKCGNDLACGHQCPAACHDAKPPAISDFAANLPPSAPGYINIRQRADESPAPFPSQLVGSLAPCTPVYSCKCS